MSGPVKAGDVTPETVEWLWGGRIARGTLSMVAGKPDQGKGLFAAHVAAEVSNDETYRKGGGRVLYSAAEDSFGLMTRPRLEAAGANLENVLLWRFALPRNGVELAQLVTGFEWPDDEVGIDLIIMDPVNAHLTDGINRHGDNVRQVTQPLTELIESTKSSVLFVEHANKRPPLSGEPLDAVGGSGSGIPAACRTAFVFGRDPDNEDRRILAKAKFNLGPAPKALAFEVDTEDIETVGETPLLVVDQELAAFDAMRLFAKKESSSKVGRPPDKRAAAAEWLTTYLAEAGGPVKSSVVQEDAKQYGMASKTLRRAADDMGVVKAPPGGGRNCTWDLPDDVKELMGLEAAAPDEAGEIAVEDAPQITDEDIAALLGGTDEAGEDQ